MIHLEKFHHLGKKSGKKNQKIVTKNEEDNILEEDKSQNQYFMEIYFEEFKHHLLFIEM